MIKSLDGLNQCKNILTNMQLCHDEWHRSMLSQSLMIISWNTKQLRVYENIIDQTNNKQNNDNLMGIMNQGCLTTRTNLEWRTRDNHKIPSIIHTIKYYLVLYLRCCDNPKKYNIYIINWILIVSQEVVTKGVVSCPLHIWILTPYASTPPYVVGPNMFCPKS